MADIKKIGFIGTGVMGGRMCRNLATKSDVPVIAFDLDPDKVAALDNAGVEAAPSIEALVAVSDLIIICVPGEPQVRTVLFEPDGVLQHVRAGQTVVDMTTATANVAKEAAEKLGNKSVDFADAPIARGVSSAEDGTLSIMVGGSKEVFDHIHPADDFSVPGLGIPAEQIVEDLLGVQLLVGCDLDLQQAAALGIEGGLEQGLGHHLAQSLETCNLRSGVPLVGIDLSIELPVIPGPIGLLPHLDAVKGWQTKVDVSATDEIRQVAVEKSQK